MTLSENIEKIGDRNINEGNYELGLDLLAMAEKGIDGRDLDLQYVKKRKNKIQETLGNKEILEQQIE